MGNVLFQTESGTDGFVAIARASAGSSKFSSAISSAVDSLVALDIPSKSEALKKRRASTKAKPYLHAVAKEKLRTLSYDEVIASLKPIPPHLGSLYLHFPFCTKHCTHCHYFKSRSGKFAEWQAFPGLLVAELRLLLSAFAVPRMTADTLHFGGGTPSLIAADSWKATMKALGECVDLSKTTEIAIEVDPADVTENHLAFWQASGVNRVSLGVQSFNDKTLDALRRQHDGSGARAAVKLAQKEGPRNLNVDLMYGMPGQGLESWFNDLQEVKALGPASITCYATRPDAINDMDTAQTFPSEAERLVANEMSIQTLMAVGYFQFSPNQFIKDYGGACWAKNNRNRCQNILGVGPHAHSILDGWFYENWVGVDTYRTNIDAARLNPLHGSRIDGDEAKHRYLEFNCKLSGLNKPLLDNGISRAGYAEIFGSDIDTDYEETLRDLTSMGLIDCSHPLVIRLTHEGILLSHEVVKQFALQKLPCAQIS